MKTMGTMNDVLKMVDMVQLYSVCGQIVLHPMVARSLDTPFASPSIEN